MISYNFLKSDDERNVLVMMNICFSYSMMNIPFSYSS